MSDMDLRYFINKMDAIILGEESKDETKDSGEVKVGNYQTRHFDMCPSATKLYKNIQEKNVDMGLAERTAKMQDLLFYLEKYATQRGSIEPEFATMAEVLGQQIMSMADMMKLKDEHSYIMDNHVKAIKDLVKS
jgi:hypothetical protein